MGDIKNKVEEVVGKVKEAAGKATENEQLTDEGRADQTKAQAKDAVDDAKNKVLGSLQD
ncbi:CsbD family protein [Corynebacterium hindlerae]|uniref:CsbD family protein n=1 Tax=Corynebacterium hindlerae TaxID=699041 RepID=A0A7G5FI94_9CORY|nr:CsbD family protein [Corynebacterium hindlerae]QMV86335.1 CsbD family protein [Corynebacterium hindlerae]QTH60022.1 CsbD family protein [Corynebacterium hindlerae]